ncbi:natural killer cells antigen CD94-like isoform X2 [Silurus meridionalis]|uniref:natural killer cells antigen CD94-like isoform X2 n=1 Tax=Silurus meridionalis TaxID=175797 RepID=UPI001EEBE8D1|nr:natural killer cells antigen CD94-like isoform X2 [Silurus meridionalis]
MYNENETRSVQKRTQETVDARKMTMVEMKELIPGEEQDAEKPVEAKKEETYEYNKLKNSKEDEDVYRQVHLYQRISAVFIILSLILLAMVLALAIKLQECQSIQMSDVPVQIDYPRNQGYQCFHCGRGWLKIENSCYFKSRERLNWQDSRKACQDRGGDLAVVHNETVQAYLSMRRGLLFWIGLHYAETEQQWIWIDNTTLTMSFWATSKRPEKPKDHCALLHGRTNSSNWHSYPCHAISQYICQKY